MTTSSTLLCFLLFMRSVFNARTLAVYRPRSHPAEISASEDGAPTELPANAKIGGMPLRLFLSERSNPGALLRDNLLYRPSQDE